MPKNPASKVKKRAASVAISPTTPPTLNDIFETETWAFDGLGPPDQRRLSEAGSVSGAIELIRQILAATEGLYRLILNHELAQACGIAEFLIENPKEWLKFCRDSYWSEFAGRKPEEKDSSKALRFVLARIFPIPERKVGKRASKFYRALTHFVQQRVPAAEIPGKIAAARGTGNLASMNAKKQSATGKDRPSDNGAKAASVKTAGSGSTKGKAVAASDKDSVSSEAAESRDYLVFRASPGGKSKEVQKLKMPCRVMVTADLTKIGDNRFAMKLIEVKAVKAQTKGAG